MDAEDILIMHYAKEALNRKAGEDLSFEEFGKFLCTQAGNYPLTPHLIQNSYSVYQLLLSSKPAPRSHYGKNL